MVLRIFTENSISPGPCRRQRGSRYTIRAGRYLCDKEFRYLRTVRVTAAVYRGFHSKLHFSFQPSSTGQVSDSIHRVTTWQSPVFLIKSRYPLVCAAFLIQRWESTPSPEVTGSFCRVPSTWFSQAPWYTLLVHLCRFGVRLVHREDRPPNSKFFPGSFNRR